MLNPNTTVLYLVGGALLVCIIAIYWMWLSNNKTKRRLNKIEARHTKEDEE